MFVAGVFQPIDHPITMKPQNEINYITDTLISVF